MMVKQILVQKPCYSLIRFTKIILCNHPKKRKNDLPKNWIFVNCQNNSQAL